MNESARIALEEARATLKFADGVMGLLDGRKKKDPKCDFSMAARHAEELHRYLNAHRGKVEEWVKKVEDVKSPDVVPASSVTLLATRRFELDAAMRFVSEAFIKPRRGDDSQVLEAADWMCVEGFRLFIDQRGVDPKDHPIGPLVALDSQRSPAVWKEDATLRIPSLFAESIQVRREGGGLERTLAPFPVICLPSDLARLPEYYVLLSHEVGHAVDTALGLSKEILTKMEGTRHYDFWSAWMREIVADAVGVALSGEAFALALWRFVQRTSLDRELSKSRIYPPIELRLAFVQTMIATHGPLDAEVIEELPKIENLKLLPVVALELKEDFDKVVMPVISEMIFPKGTVWNEDQQSVREAVGHLIGDNADEVVPKKFRLIASVFTLAIKAKQDADLLAIFRDWHGSWKGGKPDWINVQSDWKFREDLIPSLRPTILASDGQTKMPPVTLLAVHQKIAFVGSTNKWLTAALEEAVKFREGSAWEQIDVYFASDRLLEQVERYDGGKRLPVAYLMAERDDHLRKVKTFFESHPAMIKTWRFFKFDGPAVFASFWDWNEWGGRIHVSAQLLGTDIGQCPATDQIWIHDRPTPAYERYQKHLKELEGMAERVYG